MQKRHKQLDPVTFKADVSVAKEVQAMVAACVQKFRRIDFVANNAGITAPPAFTVDQDLSTFETVLRVNTKSVRIHITDARRPQQMISEVDTP